MKTIGTPTLFLAIICSGQSIFAQSPSVLYTFDNTGNAAPNVENWVKNFGTNTITISNSILGELTIMETGTAGEDVALSDGANRVRESAISSSGET